MLRLTFLLLLLASLSACLEDSSACAYNEEKFEAIYAKTWKVDTTKLHVQDSASALYFDTTILDDGTWQFIPDDTFTCNTGGKIKYTRKNNEVVQLDYLTSSFGPLPYTVIRLETDAALDGWPQPYTFYYTSFEISIESIRIYVRPFDQYNNWGPDTAFQRYWQFSLTPQ